MDTIFHGQVSAPIASVDIELPAGYSRFRLVFTGVQFDADDNLSFAFSHDDGASFVCDKAHADSYQLGGIYTDGRDGVPASAATYRDSLVSFSNTQHVGEVAGQDVFFEFEPGSDTRLASGVEASVAVVDDGKMTFSHGSVSVYRGAVVAPGMVRANKIRCVPYGEGDCDPPTTAHKIIAGAWTLSGDLA